MTLYAVITTIGGFAREDAPVPHVIGIYSDETIANQVRILASCGAVVKPIELDAIAPGYLQSAEQMGFKIGATDTQSA